MPDNNDPPRKRPRDDDDDDDRPRRRRNRDDDDDDGPRRRRRSEDEGKGSSAAIIIAIVVGVFIVGIVVVGLLVALLMPAVSKVRSAAARMSDQNNMKQVGVGFHSQASANADRMTGPYARDDFGKVQTGLSWRVSMLPYVEQNSLYRTFDLSQPWDSARNRSASNTAIKTYTAPFDGKEPSVNTPYRVFYGGGALFEADGSPVSLRDIPDGSASTILLVHAAEQVPWAAPRDLQYDPNGPLPKLGHPEQSGGFNVLMADGSVKFITDKVSDKTMRALITRAGNDTPGTDW